MFTSFRSQKQKSESENAKQGDGQDFLECLNGYWEWDLKASSIFLFGKLISTIGYENELMQKNDHGQTPQWWIKHTYKDDRENVKITFKEFIGGYSDILNMKPFRFICEDGSIIWLEIRAKILRDENRHPLKIKGIVTNMTTYKLIENEMAAIIEEREMADRAKMKFLSSINHELRSPLSGILGMSELMMQTTLSPHQERYMENIVSSSNLLLKLVNDLLDLSKLNAGKFEFEKILFSPKHVIEQSADSIQAELLKKNLDFKMELDENIPEFLYGDPMRLRQIISNLLVNAAKFTSEGGITITLTNLGYQEDNIGRQIVILRFEIEDTGIGIEADTVDKLFKDYSQADSTITRKYGGTGLGLSICKELVTFMGGQIDVVSEPGVGSTFWFELPFEHQGEDSDNRNDLSSLQTKTFLPLSILLAEDNQVNREVIVGLLELLGDEITIACNGQEAVEKFMAKKFDIVLMDINMPIMDGMTAAQEIRKLPNGHIPIIAITANTFIGDQQSCLEQGINLVMNKPIDKNILELALLPFRLSTEKNLSLEGTLLDTQNIDMVSPNSELLDLSILKNLVVDLGKEKVQRLLDIYQRDTQSLLDLIKNSPPGEGEKHAHTLAGMSENLGFQKVGASARLIINLSPNDHDFTILAQNIEQDFVSSLNELDNKMPDLCSSLFI